VTKADAQAALEKRRPFCCWDCRKPAPQYMVSDRVWRKAWPDYHEIKDRERRWKGTSQEALCHLSLCFDCLEVRLGRSLRASDFNLKLPVNLPIAKGLAMAIARRKGK
jgi:hypothetical protein